VLIKVRLEGHEFDLLILAELFREGDPAVATDHEGYCLSFTAPDGLLDDGARLHDAASVGLTGRFSDETGRQHQAVLRTRPRHALAPTPPRCRWAESSLLHH
jgi:hypothetical protein